MRTLTLNASKNRPGKVVGLCDLPVLVLFNRCVPLAAYAAAMEATLVAVAVALAAVLLAVLFLARGNLSLSLCISLYLSLPSRDFVFYRFLLSLSFILSVSLSVLGLPVSLSLCLS